ncbi:BPTI/Kunitz inhibitor domain-containing protein [Caenorhabditis elegans]|uniref:BPTI/Kunitz inhibitor domain-containing protein n=1 Tax=Caenorhabditis elegans TaxID=6239 RepID=Q95X61_CAEEL|nr:BPTI/Kunitz inhibitor domain-containing protein [Caenorhabditis elegans]CCD64409.1 BPTI/Kunitz inhibitor domain-containing protein [Caenorhabditis elegans]|eukprot:NP_504352.2 Uncharacterized protein CELE_K11D12.11 [Caenorhabditis elegans]
MLKKPFLLLASVCVVVGNKGYLLSDCQLSLHHGVQKCTNTSSLRFYMDADTETCLAFKYSGCGGNSNNFDTWGKCMRCFAADYSGCPVGSALVKNTDRNTTTCEVRGDEKCTGPNSYCRRGAFFGFCCDKTIRDKENSDQNMKEGCGPGMKKVSQKTLSGFDITLLGKTCGSKFCPQKSTCHQGNYFAYCCAAAV